MDSDIQALLQCPPTRNKHPLKQRQKYLLVLNRRQKYLLVLNRILKLSYGLLITLAYISSYTPVTTLHVMDLSYCTTKTTLCLSTQAV